MTVEFTKHFDRYVCEGDMIETTAPDGIRLVATIYRDDSGEAPDERDEGFWPSLDPQSCGYIGPRSKATLARHTARAQSVMDAWKNDEWFYCGVAVQAWLNDTPLTHKYGAALWGVDCNYPDYHWTGKPRDWYPNHYLRDVANQLVDECHDAAREKIAEIVAAYHA